MRNISPIFRLSIGLILLTVSLLLISDLLGLTPDQTRAELKARKVIAEALAVQVSTDVSEQRLDEVLETVTAMQKRNDDVLSIGLRHADGRLIAAAGDHVASWDPSIGDRSTASQVQVPIHGPDGPWGVVEVAFRPLDSVWTALLSGRSIATVILFVAFSGFAAYWLFLKRALNELDPSAVVPDRVRAALDALAEGLVIVDRAGRMVLINESFQRKLGQAAQSLIGSPLSRLNWRPAENVESTGDDRHPWQRLLDTGEVPPSSQLVLATQTKARLTFAVNCSPIRVPDGAVRGVVVTFDDLTQLEHKNSELERALERLEVSQREITRQNRELHVLATRDPLTGVLNRRSLFEGMKTLIDESVAAAEPLSAIMVDIDHFKSINDRFGHATGDKVIKLLAEILTQNVRAEDLVGRYGGEEFCVILSGVDEAKAAAVAEQMRVMVHDGKSAKFTSAMRISASFGVSTSNGEETTPGALIDLADKALYEAKESGRNRVKRWSQVSTQSSGPAKTLATPVDEKTSDSSPTEVPQEAPLVVNDPGLIRENEVLRGKVTELELAVGQLLGDGNDGFDEVTGLPNRIVLVDRIRQSMERSRRTNSNMAVLAVDVDAIKLVRDTQGIAAAEKLMRIVGERLRRAVRSADTVAIPGTDSFEVSISMIGNGEFALLLTDIQDAESTTWIVQRIFGSMEGLAEVDGREILLDTHIGVSLFPDDAIEAEDLLADAATALREARSQPDRQVCLFFSKAMNERSREQLALQSQLSQAMERGEFHLEYQPSINLTDGRISGLEALLRWQHPERGLVRPDVFIPIAEHAGLIDRLGDWVVDTATHQLKIWHDMGYDKLNISINFSALQFRRRDLVRRVVDKVHEVGIPPSALIVEITESTLIQNLDTAVSVVEELSGAGVQVALDDFGTGYSSLSYLKRFPIDIVKIDRSFLRDFPAQAHDTEIVAAIIAIAHNLGLTVVAEGVETDRQFKVLQSLQCDEIQGFLLSRPLSRNDATALLQNPAKIRRIVRGVGEADDARTGDAVVLGLINDAGERRSALVK